MTINELPIIMIRCLVLTILMESIIAFIIGIRDKKDLLNVVLANVVTNPIVVSFPFVIYMIYGRKFYKPTIYTLEVLTVIIEGFIYYKVLKNKKINHFILSLILNLGSYLIGELINIWLY